MGAYVDYETETQEVVTTEDVQVMRVTGVSDATARLIEQVVAQDANITARAQAGQRSNYTFRVSKHGSYANFRGQEDVGSPD